MNKDYNALSQIYPVCIRMDRYGGTYSRALWLAIGEFSGNEDDYDCFQDDGSAMNFDYSSVGLGSTPNEALFDLLKKKNLLEENK